MRSQILGLALTSLALGGGVGCLEEDAAMFINGVIPLNNNCEAPNQQGNNQILQGQGVFDLEQASAGFVAPLKITTNLPATFNNQDLTQARTQSPNYPSYGPVDNNVVIFQSASFEGKMTTDLETAEALQTAADGQGGIAFRGAEIVLTEATVPASGIVFNTQTTLNTSAVVTTQLLTSAQALALKQIYEDAQRATGIIDNSNNLNEDLARQFNLLALPSQRQSVEVEVAVTGETTGAQGLRPVVSAKFPFIIDLCFGCLNPSQQFCDRFGGAGGDVVVTEIDGACLPGQDKVSAQCECTANNSFVSNAKCPTP